MEFKNVMVKSNKAFYDSVLYKEPFICRKQAQYWFNQICGYGIDALYILTFKNTYYKQTAEELIKITQETFNKEY